MHAPDIGRMAAKEAAIIASCIATAFGIGRFGAYIPGINKQFFSYKLAAMLYLASIAFRMGGFFIRKTIALAFLLGMIAIALWILSVRYPALFAFLK